MATKAKGRIDIRKAEQRFLTRMGWLDSKHSFSFGAHYDPDNVGHGLLLVNNDDTVRPGTGFMTHPHQDMEIVTWVLDGELEHKDSEGNKGIICPGLAIG
jgi:quercetin 2,3-dioxygenase